MASGMAYLYCGQGALFIVSEFQKQITSTRVFRQERHRTMQRSSMLALSTFRILQTLFCGHEALGRQARVQPRASTLRYTFEALDTMEMLGVF